MASLPQRSERDDDLLAAVSRERGSSHEQAPGEGERQGIRPRRSLIWALAAVVIISGGATAWYSLRDAPKTALGTSATTAAPAVAVAVGVSETKSVPVYLVGLGTVQAFNTVIVKVRVDGQLDKVDFTEGQDVKAGEVLAQVDPRPFQATLEGAKAAKARDEAQLENAKLDLQRFKTLGGFATQQSVDTQTALVHQLEATIAGDQAAIDSAQVQLDYTTIKAPISGRTGIRLIDQGNIVHATDPNGLVVITQMQPISVIFTLPEHYLHAVSQEMAAGPLTVFAQARSDARRLGEGTVALVDNQIDQSTGSIRLKATFPNDNHALWPGQFVNIQVLLRTLQQVVTVPSTAVQRGPDGMYVYVVKPDSTVAMAPVSVGQMNDGTAVVRSGLDAGVKIVVAGQYRLAPGMRVTPDPAAVPAPGGS
jgi:multidrug efflux system membrane fusion protein